MKPITFLTPRADGTTIESIGYPCGTSGLLVTRPFGVCGSLPRDGESDECWTVTHARSGHGIMPVCWASPEPAALFAIKLGTLLDWQLTGAELMTAFSPMDGTIVDLANQLGARNHFADTSARARFEVDNGVIV